MSAIVSAPDEIDRKKLSKLLGLCSSNHDGEVLAAARKADALVRRAGLTWPEVIEPRACSSVAGPRTIAEAIRLCADNTEVLTRWERGFVAGLATYRKLSERQIEVLDCLVEKVRASLDAEAP